MNILSSIHLYPPYHLCGAEMMIHQMHKFLMSKGHTTKVLVKQANKLRIENHYIYDQVDVFGADEGNEMNLFRNADMVMTHLDYAAWTQEMCSIYAKPCFHLIHNHYIREHILNAYRPQFIIYNSNWIKDVLKYSHESFVLYPPTDWRHYDVKSDPWDHEYITLINLDQNKGGEILREVATQMPDIKFLAVKGSYSYPAKLGQITNQPPNVKVVEKHQDIREIYRRTRILLMPSKEESWGRTATEAMCSGIPVIASPTPGLVENCANAGIFVTDRDNVDEWVKQIRKLYNEKTYRKASEKAKIRSRELDPQKNLAEFEQWIREKKNGYTHK
jgi:glycosyltransferase involved in cell wall biosynthesis